METENIFEEVLIKPGKDFQELFIVVGYATPTFLRKHLTDLKKAYKTNKHKINLIIGMDKKSAHLEFINVENDFPGQFSGFYLDSPPPIHSKVYLWKSKDGYLGFSGSANYSDQAFDPLRQINQMVRDEPKDIKKFYDGLKDRLISIDEYDFDINTEINVISESGNLKPGAVRKIDDLTWLISLLDKRKSFPPVPIASGLNWGHSMAKKNKNSNKPRNIEDAYLSIKGDARIEGFLPRKERTFSLITDDEQSFDCTAQGNAGKHFPGQGKQIAATYDNRLLGIYFRDRIGLPSNKLIVLEDLENYGRTDFLLRKIDDETFYLDFSV